MARTEMHEIPGTGLGPAVDYYTDQVTRLRASMASDCYTAHALHRRAFSLAAVRWAATRDEDALARDLAMVAEAGTVCFEAALTPDADITHHLGPDPDTALTVPGRGDRSFAVAEVFCDAFNAARLLRADALLDRLCGAPAALLDDDAESPPFRLALARCLHASWADGTVPPQKLLAAMNATDPGALPEDQIDEAIGHAAPSVHLLSELAGGDAPGFAQALADYQAAHRRHYALPDHALEDRGLLSLDQAAIAAMAMDAGLDPAPASDYLPQRLIRNAP